MAAVAEIYPASDGQGQSLLVVEFANGNFRKFASAVEQQALLKAAEALAIAPAAPSSNGTNDVDFVDAAPGDLTDEYIY
ncbi:MAG: hypothetical protein HC925_00050 [Coleofasciculaceae cyanobacterium SM2_3_26]|nr:hypothetical protein [Coleofasciculaceae cyanobacterium SM2_3_26]